MTEPYLNLLSRLAGAGVDFVLIGGYACIAQGGFTSTEDVDICCDFVPDNLLRLYKAISDLHPVHRMTPKRLPFELTPENSKTFKNLYLDTDLGQLDCISYVQGLGDFGSIQPMCETLKVGETQIKILNIDALIQSKKSMNRPKDREVVRELESIKKIEKKSKGL
jgi:hypothetical protein